MQKIDVRSLIMEEAKKIGETRNIETISVKEICERCGISRPTFYSYFRDKYDLVNETYRSTIAAAFKSTDISASWPEFLSNIMKSIKNNRRFYMNSVKYTGQNSLKDTMLFYTYRGYIGQTTIRIGAEPDESLLSEIRFNAYGSTGLVLDWIQGGMAEDPYEIAERICRCMPERLHEIFFGK